MNLIDLPSPPVKPVAEQIAELMLHKLNATLAERVHDHRIFFPLLWRSSVTPDDILEAMGEHGPILVKAAKENLLHISRLAALVGKTLNDFIAAEDYVPPRPFLEDENGDLILTQEGHISLAPPAEGLDAWGNPIPEPEPEPDPE